MGTASLRAGRGKTPAGTYYRRLGGNFTDQQLKKNVINQPKPGLAGELDMDRQQNHLGGLPEVKPTKHTDESRDHKQLPPEPHRTPQKDALGEVISRKGISLPITSLCEFFRA